MYRRYQHLVIEDPDEPPDEDEIRDIELALDAKLPYDFLNFLDAANGGRLQDYFLSVPLLPKAEVLSFSSLFSTKRPAYGGFLFELERHTSSDYIFQIPERVLPIASGAGGIYLYLDLRSSDSTPVIAFIRGLPDWTGLHPDNTFIKLADTFTEYLAVLQLDVSEQRELLEQAILNQDTDAISANIDFLQLALPNWRDVFGFDYDDGRPKQRKLWTDI